ncbi:MAG: OmpA family protein [Gemmatimonadales bacterium]
MRLRSLPSGAMVAGVLAFAGLPLQAQTVLSGFQGSREKGVYEAEFDALIYPRTMERNSAVERIEGVIRSRVFVRPAERTNLEVFRSYQRELGAAGFETVVSGTPNRAMQNRIWEMYRASDVPIHGRRYRATDDRVASADLARIETFVDYYLVARQVRPERTLYVAILISRDQGLYLVDELTAAGMAAGTVTLTLDAMKSAMAESGKVAIYDVRFATGSAVIDPASAEALKVIAAFLAATPGRFYVVGHTDDTGGLEDNLRLSEQRAAAVKAALVADHGVKPDRLETRGVGPLAPVGTNAEESGRALNRRVEVVRRLP